MTALDGDLTLTSIIDLHGPQTVSNDDSGRGGDIDIFVGRDGTISGTMDPLRQRRRRRPSTSSAAGPWTSARR